MNECAFIVTPVQWSNVILWNKALPCWALEKPIPYCLDVFGCIVNISVIMVEGRCVYISISYDAYN